MRKSRWWSGVFVTLIELAGFVVVLTSAHRSAPLWQVWAALAVSLCATAGLVATYGISSWRHLSQAQRLPWRKTEGPARRRLGRDSVIKKMGYQWRLRHLMAERDMFHTSDIVPLLAEHGVVLSREQVYRLVTQPPQRMSMDTS